MAQIVRLAGVETPVAGVELEPYVLLQRPDGSQTTEDVPETSHASSSATGVCLRQRWLRALARVCSVHPERHAQIQNLISKTFHCSADCLLSSWPDARAGLLSSRSCPSLHQPYASNNGSSLSNGDSPGPPSSANGGWREVSRTRTYVPTQEDIGHTLRFEVTPLLLPTKTEAAASAVLYTGRVITPAPPPSRSLVPLMPTLAQQQQRITVLSYNILADLYAHSDAYAHLPSWVLSWAYRRRQLLREILAYDSDVVALQEVQSDHLEQHIAPAMHEAGYEYTYKAKNTKMFTGSKVSSDGCITEGCATFWKTSKLKCVKADSIDYDKAVDNMKMVKSNGADVSVHANRLRKDNIALLVVLSTKPQSPLEGTQRFLCIANTHVHANSELTDVKLLQVHTLLKGLEKFRSQIDFPMCVCGDFNSPPGSAAHQLVVEGGVDPRQPELEHDPLSILNPPSELRHDLQLQSCFQSLARTDTAAVPDCAKVQEQQTRLDPQYGEPVFTNYTRDFESTLDYIFHTRGLLETVAVLELPSKRDIEQQQADEPVESSMPNSRYVSDHVAIMCELEFRV
jgi:CCR4-NOT transcription complex subunit 6